MTTTPQAALLREAAQNALITLDGIADTNPRDTADFETPAEWIAWAKSRARWAADALRAPIAQEIYAERILRKMLHESDQSQATHQCGTCGHIGIEDPVKGCPKCGFDDMRAKLQATQEPVQAGELPALPHDGWPARFRCDSCDGNGEIGELISMGHFQPPERQTCPDCGGRGWSDEGPAFNADHMRDYARAALSARKPLTMLEPTQIADACAGIYASDHAGKAYDQAVAIAAITEFCRINGIGLEVNP